MRRRTVNDPGTITPLLGKSQRARLTSAVVGFCAVALAACSSHSQPTPVETPSTANELAPGPALTPAAEGAAVSGVYRNVFVERGFPEAEVAEKLAAMYRQLFHGVPDTESILFDAGSNEHGRLAYVMDIGNSDVRSEGMSYGMMIAVQMDEQADFDALWNWALTYMYHGAPDHPAHGYFAWQVRPDGTVIDPMPAPDGEEYFATALLFAANRWGEGSGHQAYKEHALRLLDKMKNRAPITGTVNGKETTGVALFNPEHKMVRFTPNTDNFSVNGDHTDPSYHVPAFYELWALWGPDADREFWMQAAQTSRDYFVKATHPKTALTPDYAGFDGKPVAASWDPNTAQFRYDAWRTVMNWSVDASWWAKDPRETELSDRLVAFFSAIGKVYPNTYQIDGTPTSQSSSSGLVAMNAVAALSATDPRAWQFVDAQYRQAIPTGKWRYYDGMLYALSMLHLSGGFRVHGPVH